MPRYIDADLIDYNEICVPMLDGMIVRTKKLDGLYAKREDIEGLPTVDVQEIRHGSWKLDRFGNAWCSACHHCGSNYAEVSDYCPNCGAKMDLEEKNDGKTY